MSDYGGYVDPSYLEASGRVLADLKQRSFDALALDENDRVLDVGCGTGIDTCHLRTMLANRGLVVGIDADAAMVAAANLRVGSDPGAVVHMNSDARALPFRECSFDAVRSERLLQHVDDPGRVVSEMVRVLKPGRHVAVLDTDWATLSMDSSLVDVERRLVRYKSERLTRNGSAGRQLFRLFRSFGLEAVNVVPFPLIASFELFRVVSMWEDLVASAVTDGVITAAEGKLLEEELVERDRDGCSFGSLNLNLATGRKPHELGRTALEVTGS